MKRTFKTTVFFLSLAVIFASCVTKQKYNELKLKYDRCNDELTFMTSENQNCQEAKKSLTAQLNGLTADIEQLRKDTLRLFLQANGAKREYEKAKNDYDELLQNLQ